MPEGVIALRQADYCRHELEAAVMELFGDDPLTEDMAEEVSRRLVALASEWYGSPLPHQDASPRGCGLATVVGLALAMLTRTPLPLVAFPRHPHQDTTCHGQGRLAAARVAHGRARLDCGRA